MNYLAHIHLAHVTNTSMLGNFFGDFVKGSDLSHLNEAHQLGVRLHRCIDSFTDSHSQVQTLKSLFPKSIRRMSGIVLDIYFDHLLCVHWAHFTDRELDGLLIRFYDEVEHFPTKVSDRFQRVRQRLLDYRWLADYQKPAACERSFIQIEKRLGSKVLFAAEAAQFIHKHNHELNERFLRFYPELIVFSQRKAESLSV